MSDRPEHFPGIPTDPDIFGGHFDEDDSYGYRRPAGMDDWLIFLTIHGEGFIRTPAGEQRMTEGAVCLLKSGVPHEYGTVAGGRWNFLWAHFRRLPETDYLPDEEALVHVLPEGELRERVKRDLQHLIQDSRDRGSYWRALCENSLRNVVLLLASRLEKRIDPRIEQAVRLLSQSLNKEIRIADVAKAVGLSASRLSHLFKQETGESIVERFNGMRLQQAALLMERMGRTATEASYDVGFRNYNHFAMLFRQAYGVSPRTYKQRRDQTRRL
ncbi:helix-turn-helix domain-containing protein [Cohnella suwonensis]|uniref:Helix-turn-helix domain-containing protein n=1 Tax=Cohnella suwonensis TaxID=696072 RepID=A0ABW0M1E6_9BACL